MSNILKLFKSDMRHLAANVVSCIIAIGLIVIPSLFAWYNILACWDVFDNTGNLKVAVANTDEGYKSDLIPVEVNVGDMVVSELRGNDQIGWQFVGEDDAIDGAKSGKYYAAVVIPPEFSRDMLTFYSDDVEHAQIIYYSNEKKNPISPKVTTIGADTISSEVNQVFAKTLSEIGISLAQSISNYADETDANGRIGELADHMASVGDGMESTASVMSLYANVLDSSKSMVEDCSGLISKASDSMEALGETADDGLDTISSMADTVSASAKLVSSALKDASASFDQISAKIDDAFDEATQSATDAAADLRAQASTLATMQSDCNAMADALDAMADAVAATDPAQAATLRDAATNMRQTATLAGDMATTLNAGADALDAGVQDAAALRAEATQMAADAKASIDEVQSEFDSTIRPALEELATKAGEFTSQISGNAEALDDATDWMLSKTQSLGSAIGAASASIRKSAASLTDSAAKVKDVSESIHAALASSDADSLKAILKDNSSSLATALSTPVGVERHALYESPNFGSSMAPFYSTLAIFIGSLLIMVAVKPTVTSRATRNLDNPKPRQLFLGRFGVVAFISLAQTTIMALGNIFFLQVKVAHPLLLMLCFWITGLVFAFFIYSLVYSFANLGKAIAVILLIMQITGCGGSYPLQILPDFVQALSPWLPATHAVNAMRAAMFGVYQGDFWIQMRLLSLFIVPAALLGLALRKPFERFMKWYIAKVESTEVIA